MSGAGSVRRLPAGTCSTRGEAAGEALLAGWSSVERARERARAEAVDLAFALAARLMGDVARDHGAVLRAALEDAARVMGDAPTVLVRVHPDDVSACRGALVDAPFAGEVVADANVSRGGVILESVKGVVDARVSVRLARLRALLGGAT